MNITEFSLRRRQLMAAAACSLAVPAVRAQAYPTKPIRLVVPYPPGGGTDIVARLLAQKMSTALGQQVLVENKPGASTLIGTDLVAKSTPDGYTIGLITDSHAINPTFFPKLPYDTFKDFAPVSQLVFVPLMMVAHPSLKVKTLGEFIALAKAQPGRIAYASIGNGTPHQLSMEWLRSLAGIELTHVPYKGVAPALTDLIGGQVQVMFTGTSSAAPYVKDGRLVPLAVSTGKRQPAFPDVPAVSETLPEFDFVTWYGVTAPARTPPEALHRLSREIGAALALPDVKERLASLGVEGAPSTPEAFSVFIHTQADRLRRLVQLTGVKAE